MSAQKNEPPKRTSELHRSVPFSEYLSWPLWSQSVIKCGRVAAQVAATEKVLGTGK